MRRPGPVEVRAVNSHVVPRSYSIEASKQDIEFAATKFTVSDTDRSMTFGEIAGGAYFPPGPACSNELATGGG